MEGKYGSEEVRRNRGMEWRGSEKKMMIGEVLEARKIRKMSGGVEKQR